MPQVEIVSPARLVLALGGLLVVALLVWGGWRLSAASPALSVQAAYDLLPFTPTQTPTATPVPTATPFVPENPRAVFACLLPVEYGRVTSHFGDVRSGGMTHKGVDYGCTGERVAVLSPMTGMVTHVGALGDLGNAIVLENWGWKVILGHLAFWRVKEGERVQAGDVVGICGSTGNSSGPHVHLEIYYWNDRWGKGGWMLVNPEKTDLPGAEGCRWGELQNLP